MKLFKRNISEIKPGFPNIVEKFLARKITDEVAKKAGYIKTKSK